MSEFSAETLQDLADTRWILAETRNALQDARRQLRQMDRSMNAARSWLTLIEERKQGRDRSVDRKSQAESVRSFSGACEQASEAGLAANRRIGRAVANIKAAVVMVDGLRRLSIREELSTGRLRRELIALQKDLEMARSLTQRVSERLEHEAERARQSLPGFDRHGAGVEPGRASGSLLRAFVEGSRVGEELDRAQGLTTQTARGVDLISEAARERMAAHHEPSHRSPAAPPVP